MSTDSELMAHIKNGSELSQISKSLRKKDTEGTIASIAGLVGSLASGIPVVGKLASEGARWLFARSAYGRLEKIAAEIDEELEREQRDRKLAHAIAELVAQSLLQLGEPEGAVTRVAGHRDPQFIDFRYDASERVRVNQGKVHSGATGVELGTPKGRDVSVEQDEITGAGTVGVKL